MLMIPEYIFVLFLPIGFCLFIVASYYRGKKIENVSKVLSKKEIKQLRTELMEKRDLSWLAIIRLPKMFEYIGNILALLVILLYIYV